MLHCYLCPQANRPTSIAQNGLAAQLAKADSKGSSYADLDFSDVSNLLLVDIVQHVMYHFHTSDQRL